ncbi:GntR family transcriptional regulator [Neorhizobium galegae]|uniref:GntR family transcriptional regulator n=1 Tax=Neorhizobium galegae TaxID=399 RepID=UPI0009BAE3DA|nr:GntR family transcriptional regulator [Neorhizobium galegae]
MRTSLPDLQIDGRGDTLGEQVYSRLREAILLGVLKPGQKLSVRALANSLNVSLTPTRDALARLIAEDVVKQGPDRTVFVPVLDLGEINEVFDLRCLLEKRLAEQAVANSPKSLAPMLRKIQNKLVLSIEDHDYKRVVARNFEFHFTLYAAANAKVTVKLVENLWLRVGPMLNLLYPEFDRTRSGVRKHAAILECVEKGAVQEVGMAIQSDILGAKSELIRVVSSLMTSSR